MFDNGWEYDSRRTSFNSHFLLKSGHWYILYNTHKHKFATVLVNFCLQGFKHTQNHFLTEGLILQALNSFTGFVWRFWGHTTVTNSIHYLWQLFYMLMFEKKNISKGKLL